MRFVRGSADRMISDGRSHPGASSSLVVGCADRLACAKSFQDPCIVRARLQPAVILFDKPSYVQNEFVPLPAGLATWPILDTRQSESL
jgi:hypothetical protein